MAKYSINELDDLLEKKIQMIMAEQGRVNGITSFSAPYVIAQRITNAAKKANEFSIIRRMDAYVDIDTKNDVLAKQLDDISNLEAKNKQHFFDTQKTKVGRDNLDYYLESYAEIIAKLRIQRIHYEKNGLNVFSLGKQAFMQLKKNSQVTLREMESSATDKIKSTADAIQDKKVKIQIWEAISQIAKGTEKLEDLKRKYPEAFDELMLVTENNETKSEDENNETKSEGKKIDYIYPVTVEKHSNR